MMTRATPAPFSMFATLDDTAVLPVDNRRDADPVTWAWDTFDETPALYCRTCATLDDDAEDARDGDTCEGFIEDEGTGREYRCGSTETVRVIATLRDRRPSRRLWWQRYTLRPAVD